jgi:hypothetical protein
MIGAICLFLDFNRLLKEWFSISIAPLDPVKLCEIAERRRDIGMIFAKNFFQNRERLFVQGFSIGIATLSFVQRS